MNSSHVCTGLIAFLLGIVIATLAMVGVEARLPAAHCCHRCTHGPTPSAVHEGPDVPFGAFAERPSPWQIEQMRGQAGCDQCGREK